MDRLSNPAENPTLRHCFAMMTGSNALLRSQGIISLAQSRELFQFAKTLVKNVPLRLSSMQLNPQERDWNLIQRQHRCLIHQDPVSVAHISLPTEPLYFKPPPTLPTPYFQKAMARLLHHFNAEGWIVYSSWLCGEVEHQLSLFQPDASEEYQLQARLVDFIHEVHSGLLRDLRLEIRDLLLAQEKALVNGKQAQIFELEKILAERRARLVQSLQSQEELLKMISRGIVIIQGIHPELMPLKIKVDALLSLISADSPLTWGQRVLTHQFLDEKLGVVSSVNCETGIDRTNFVFAIRAALMDYPLDDHRLGDFCRGLSEEKESNPFSALVLQQLEKWSLPRENPIQEDKVQEEKVNVDLLPFLPNSLVERDGNGNPTGCTLLGRRVLRRLGVI